MMDIVYILKVDPINNNEELRYSLRSLGNIPHGRVFIVGEKPDWVTNITYIPVAQDCTKAENAIKNIRTAAESPEISDDFILMNDDFFFMKKLDALPAMNFGKLADMIRLYEQRYPEGSDYVNSMKMLHALLKDRGCVDPVSYELHTPMMFNKQKLRQMYDETGGQFYQARSYYGNLYGDAVGATVTDVKIFLDPTHNDPAYNNSPHSYLSQQILLSSTGGAFKTGYPGQYIRSIFPDKSIYEI